MGPACKGSNMDCDLWKVCYANDCRFLGRLVIKLGECLYFLRFSMCENDHNLIIFIFYILIYSHKNAYHYIHLAVISLKI